VSLKCEGESLDCTSGKSIVLIGSHQEQNTLMSQKHSLYTQICSTKNISNFSGYFKILENSQTVPFFYIQLKEIAGERHMKVRRN